MLFPVVIDEEKKDAVELVPLKASAGYGRVMQIQIHGTLTRIKLPFYLQVNTVPFLLKEIVCRQLKEGSFVVAKIFG